MIREIKYVKSRFFMYAVFIALFFLLLNSKSLAQKNIKIEALNRFEIIQKDTLFRFYSVRIPKKIRLQNDKNYYGHVKDTIIITQGGVAERILHGSFTAFFPNRNLHESGKFSYGLKSGEWKTWFPNGQLKQLSNWKSGELDGRIEEYDLTGKTIKSGNYKNKLFTGFSTEIESDGKEKKVQYNKGEIKDEN